MLARAVGRGLDGIAEPGRGAPHDAGLRQHAPAGRAPRPPARRAARARTTSLPTTAACRKERRLRIEQRLRAGDLKALVATASLELGIDIGPVELVCQIGSPRSVATFLQRVGRSGHSLGAAPKGRLYPTTRDELIECAALLRAVRAGELDRVAAAGRPARHPRPADRRRLRRRAWNEDELFALVPPRRAVRRPVPRRLRRGGGDAGRGHRDRARAPRRVSPPRPRQRRRCAGGGPRASPRITSGGAIPETADYRVVADPDDTVVGTVDEDCAIESMAGDIFLLGSTSWRIRRVEPGEVRVVDAAGAPPTIPFWLGEAPGRTAELSAEVSDLRARVGADRRRATRTARATGSQTECGLGAGGGRQVVALPGAPARRARRAADPAGRRLRALLRRDGRHAARRPRPVRRAHQPRPRAWPCASASAGRFDFELQAAANDDAVVLSLGPQQSLPLDDLPHFLSAGNGARTRSPRRCSPRPCSRRAGAGTWGAPSPCSAAAAAGAIPPPIQRMEADDLHGGGVPRAWPPARRTCAGPARDPRSPAWCARPSTTVCTRPSTSTGWSALLERHRRGRRAGRTSASRRSRRRSPTRSSTAGPTRTSTTRRSRSAARARWPCAAACPRPRATWGGSTPRPSPGCATRRGLARATPTSCTTCCSSLVVLRPQPDWTAWFEELATAAGRDLAAIGDDRLWIATESLAMGGGPLPRAPRSRPPSASRRARLPRAARSGGAAVAAVRGHIGMPRPRRRARPRAPGRSAREPRRDRAPQPRGGGVAPARPVRSRAGRRRRPRVLRAAPPRAHPPLHDGAAASGDRAGHRPGPSPLRPPLAARGAGHPVRGAARASRGDRAAPGLRARRRILGGDGVCRARGRLSPGVAGRSVPLRRGRVGQARPARARRRRAGGRGRPGRGRPVALHAGELRAGRQPAVAPRLRARRCGARASRRGSGARSARVPHVPRRALLSRAGRPSPDGFASRSRRGSGISSRAASSPPTDSGAFARCSRRASAGPSARRARPAGAACAAPPATASPSRAAGRSCPVRNRTSPPPTGPTSRRWPRRSPSSSSPAMGSCSAICSRARASPCRGARSCGRSGASRRAGTVRGGRFVTGFTGEQYALPEAVDALRQTAAPRAHRRDRARRRGRPAEPRRYPDARTARPRRARHAVVYRDGLPSPPPSPLGERGQGEGRR